MELKPKQRTELTSWARCNSDSYFWLWPRLELLCEPKSLTYKIYPTHVSVSFAPAGGAYSGSYDVGLDADVIG